MKTCGVCGLAATDAATCPACGEASWCAGVECEPAEEAPPAMEPIAESAPMVPEAPPEAEPIVEAEPTVHAEPEPIVEVAPRGPVVHAHTEPHRRKHR